MRIYSMTATFGKLEQQTLRLQPGLNILEYPNEWGKSTWCAFLVAMLYGVDTRSHTTKTVLADKERYAPWSGSPMAGQLEIHWRGRDITVQRRTRGRIPLGEFQAFETDTGLPVAELTAENCGQQLLGVEKPVFLRSAFLRGSDLPVEQEESLRRRLNALVTTGDESATADTLAKKLRDLKNRIHANRTTGLLPQAYARRGRLQQDLDTLESLRQQTEQLGQQLQKLEARREALELHRQALDYQAGLEAGQKYARAQAGLTAALREEAHCREQTEHLPKKDWLEAQLQQLNSHFQEQQRLRQALTQQEAALVPESTPIEAAADAKKFHRLRLWSVLLILPVPVLAAAGLWHGQLDIHWPSWALYGTAAALLIAGILLALAAGKLHRRYPGPSELWAAEAQRQQQAYAHRSALEAQLQAIQAGLLKLTAGEPAEAYGARLRRELELWGRLETAIQNRMHAQSLAAALQSDTPLPEAPKQQDLLSLSRQETRQQLAQTAAQLQQAQLRLGECRGQMAALGQPAALQAALAAEEARITQLEETYAATRLALNALAEARQELQRRFAPQIVKKTQALFSRLTDGRYGQLAMEEDLRLHIRAEGESTVRPSLWRSEGTVDQLYLALRLAVASELVPDAPMILDDALVRFDDIRLALAMDVLRQEAETRQILLFTCQSRENSACNGHNCVV